MTAMATARTGRLAQIFMAPPYLGMSDDLRAMRVFRRVLPKCVGGDAMKQIRRQDRRTRFGLDLFLDAVQSRRAQPPVEFADIEFEIVEVMLEGRQIDEAVDGVERPRWGL